MPGSSHGAERREGKACIASLWVRLRALRAEGDRLSHVFVGLVALGQDLVHLLALHELTLVAHAPNIADV